jgi:hypothetical protein
MDVGDLNGDGRLDILVVDDGQDKVLINTGNGADGFADFTPYTIADSLSEFGNTARLVDLDRDGKLDAIICDVDADLGPFCPSSGRQTKIYRNTGVVGTLLLDQQGLVLPATSLDSVYDICPVDLDGDGWLDLVVGRCGGIEVYMNDPPIGITFSYPSGRPAFLNPDAPNSFGVQATVLGGGSIVAGTANLFVSLNGGAFTAYPMSSSGSNLFTANFPDVDCGDNVRYYVGATLSNGGPETDPQTAPTTFYSGPVQTGESTAFSTNFEGTVTGWTATADASVTFGGWVAGTPVGSANGGVQAAPSADATPGSGVACYHTGLGTAGGAASGQDLDGGPVTLTSPVFDLSSAQSARVSFAAWFYCDDLTSTPTQADGMRIEVSNGGPWRLLEDIRQNVQWATKTYDLGASVTLNSTVSVRFVVSDNPNNSVTEAGVDDFVITIGECQAAPACPGDFNNDGVVGGSDLASLLGGWGTAKFDLDGDGTVGGADLAALLGAWGACP